MHISDYDYFLPSELIAQMPSEERQRSRVLLVNRAEGSVVDASFSDLPTLLRPDDVLILNNTKVFPARLRGVTESGAQIEIFLVRQTAQDEWEALARPGRRLKPGKKIVLGEKLHGEIVEKMRDGKVIVRFHADGNLDEMIDNIGQMPLPPYIKRPDETLNNDRERYQTVYAKNRGAIAAPTAGLHFTPQTLEIIRARGVTIAEITLHVGYGTFEPVRANDLADHTVLPERYEIDAETSETLNAAKSAGRRFVAVGTTTTRALESTLAKFGSFVAGQHCADLTITPGYRFLAIDALLTNFHLPQSSLLVLTSTFGGHQLIMDAYRHAVAAKYRFYSYGDCMFIS